MAKISEDCLQEALQALKNFPKEDLEQYVRDVFVRARSYDNLTNMRAFDKAIQEINDETKKSLFEDATIKANNVLKYDKNAKDLIDKKVDMRGLISKRGKFLGRNIRVNQQAELEKVTKFVFGDLSHEEVEHLTSGKNDEDIADSFDGKQVKNPMSKKIADKLRDYMTYRNARMIVSNALRLDEINEDRYFRAIHDPTKIITGAKNLIKLARDNRSLKRDPIENKNNWRNTIKKYLDIPGTFLKTKAADLEGNIDMGEVDKILDNTYSNITTGKSVLFTKSVVANDREAMKKKMRMFFKWKSLRDQYEYNKVYGKGNLFGMLHSDMQATANKIGMAQMFGDNPESMFNDLKHIQLDVFKKDNIEKGGFWWRNTENYFNSVKGSDKLSIDPKLSNFMSNIRSLTSMARLPLVTIQSLSDIGFIASFAQRMGISYFRSYVDHLSHLFNFFPNEERSRIANLMRTQVDSQLGYMGRWSDINSASDLINKITTKFFKFNLLHAFDTGNRIGMMHMMAKHLFENSKKKFKDLAPSLQKWVGKFLDSNEWDLLRKKNQVKLFTTDNVDSLTDAEIREHYQNTDKSLPMNEVRDDLYRKVYSMFVVAAENSVLSPTEFEDVFMHHGTNPGTVPGQILRSFSQFKMFSLAYIDRVLIHGYKDADTVSQKIMWATSMLVGTIPLSMLSNFLSNVGMNKTNPDYDQMNIPQREQYLLNLLAPSLGMFSGFLDPRNQNSSMLWGLLGSPTFKLISELMAAPTALMGGNAKLAAKNLGNAAGYLVPTQTFPVLTPIIQHIMGEQAHLEPGQSEIIGR